MLRVIYSLLLKNPYYTSVCILLIPIIGINIAPILWVYVLNKNRYFTLRQWLPCLSTRAPALGQWRFRFCLDSTLHFLTLMVPRNLREYDLLTGNGSLDEIVKN